VKVVVSGQLVGERSPNSSESKTEQVVLVSVEHRSQGPAENSMIMVELSKAGTYRGRYLSWIGYADLDQANSLEFGRWKLIEPPSTFTKEIEWQPFGWGPLESVYRKVG
jgi:hypothetical protein